MEIRFCPSCGSALRTRSSSNHHQQPIPCSKCKFVYYPYPKPCVGAIIAENGKILLIQRAEDPFKGFWDFPGGFLEFDEHPEIGLKREVSEELDVEVKVSNLIGVYMDYYHDHKESTLNIYYTCRILNGSVSPQTEVSKAEWFKPDNLPKKMAFNHADDVLKDWRNSVPK